MGYMWLEEAGLISGTPEWEEREEADSWSIALNTLKGDAVTLPTVEKT